MGTLKRVQLGTTPLQVTRLGLGTAPLGGLFEAVADDEAHRVVEAAWKAGIRFFDTAPLYGHGLAELRLGAVLSSKPRDEFVLATKVGRLLRAGAPPEPGQAYKGVPPVNPVFDFSYDGVMRSVEESLSRLGLDRIDVLHIHDPDDHFEEALTGAYRALDRLRDEGSIRAVGAGMNQSEMLVRFAREANFDCPSCCRCAPSAGSPSSRAACSTAASWPTRGRAQPSTTRRPRLSSCAARQSRKRSAIALASI